jgi:hypothetical protein
LTSTNYLSENEIEINLSDLEEDIEEAFSSLELDWEIQDSEEEDGDSWEKYED